MNHSQIEAGLGPVDPELAEWVRIQWRSLVDQVTADDLEQLRPCLDTLPRVWAASEFIARTCVTRPWLLNDLMISGDLFNKYPEKELTRRIRAMTAESEAALMQNLRRTRLREALRIAWRDLAGWADLDEVISTMSELANAAAVQAHDYAYQALCERFGIPHGESSDKPVRMTLLALGKLGGGELNFSSDIDLIFAYSESGETDHPKAISNHEFFLKLARQLITILESTTVDGIVFRVDMRLRPNGQSGPLALSFDAMEHYYQTHGRDWERYALIKARVIDGDDEPGRELLARLQPFIYRRYLDYGAFEAVRSMKEMISRQLRRKGVQNNIKLGRGGIREIEFIAQSFQLIRGGREPLLQTNRLVTALEYLARSGTIADSMCTDLIAAYTYLRRLEHRLQMIRDQQTHRLPDRDMDRKRLLLATNHEHWSDLSQKITTTCDSVQGYFEQTFLPVHETGREATDDIGDLWLGLLDSTVAHRALSALGYRETGGVIDELRVLHNSRLYHAHSNIGRERLDLLMPMCIRAAVQSPDPDTTLSRLIQFIEGVGRRSAYLVLLIENPLALSQLIRLIGASAWVSSWIRQHPLLLDELLDPITASMGNSPKYIDDELEPRLAQVEPDDLELQMDILREVRHGQSLRVAAADVSGLIDWVEVGRRLSMIAQTLLSRAVDLCTVGLSATLGRPSADIGAEPATLGVVAYGKLGGLELGYNSDLDIVFLHHGARAGGETVDGARHINNTQYYLRLVQRVVHILTTRTAAGVLYEIDMRLRPSGRAGPMVTTLEGFHNYQRNHAWTWEHQALVRARMIFGPEPLRARFDEIRRDILCQWRDPEKLGREISEMRSKMSAAHDTSDEQQFDLKHGRGGIVDIEFIVQYCVLNWGHAYPDIIIPRNTIESIRALRTAGLMEENSGRTLADAYYRYLAAEHQAKLAEQPARVAATELLEHREHVEMLWQRLFD
jgi:glutamate-ammonia-ligase adenylyltransferase